MKTFEPMIFAETENFRSIAVAEPSHKINFRKIGIPN